METVVAVLNPLLATKETPALAGEKIGTRARLQSRFADGIRDPGEFEKVIAEQFAMPPAQIAAWRQSEMERAGCREGTRLAALEFYWEQRQMTARQRKGPVITSSDCSLDHGDKARDIDP